jgi:16S rRNA (uracil1498-N3)-methyltransferase
MSKVRRFRVQSLDQVVVGDALILPPEEVKHARVLRLDHDTPVELFDDSGRSAHAVLASAGGELAARIIDVAASVATTQRLTIATAWPKGKRASVLVEKCTELGLERLMPIHYARSVVSKEDETEGVARLRRIAVESAKQSGRNEPLLITPELSFTAALREIDGALALIADPRATNRLVDILHAERSNLALRVVIFIGPEGGFSPEELAEAQRSGMRQVKLARNVLRVETAAIAACAITRAILD